MRNLTMLAYVLIAFCLQAQQQTPALKDFREWRSLQPAETDFFDLYTRYRAHLKQKGMTDAEIQIAFRELETDRWNTIYSGAPRPMFNSAPNAFLVEMVKGRKPGRALDIVSARVAIPFFLPRQGGM